ncbi:MAG TPA: hypothetical protein VHS59_08250, partial [Bacillota bacterium]|nr:hypothetical protein [Bacillota bacterium]
MPFWKNMWETWMAGRFGAWLRQRTWRRFLAGTVFFLAFSMLIGINYLPENLDLKEGQIAPKDILAPRSIVYQDKLATESLRQAAAARILPAYYLEPTVIQNVENNIYAFVEKVRQTKNNNVLTDQQKVNLIKSGYSFSLKDAQAKQFLQYGDETLNLIEESAGQLVRQVLTDGVEPDKLQQTRESITKTVNELPVRREQRESIRLLAVNFLQPNKTYNEAETKQRIQAARDSVNPVNQTILAKQKIVSKGEPLTKDQVQKLEALGLLRVRGNWSIVLGIACMVILSMALVLAYIRQFLWGMYKKDQLLILLGITVFITLLVARGILAISFADRPEFSELIGYLVPVSAGAMLITVLLDSHLAIVVSILLNV